MADMVVQNKAIFSVSHKSRVIGEVCYLLKYGKFKKGKVVAKYMVPVQCIVIFPADNQLLHSLQY
jgi:hypothetical protein